MKTIALELNTFPLTALMDKSLDSWGIKDRNSRFIYTNRAFLDCFNLPQGVDIIGKRHDELPSCVVAFLANLHQEEKKVIKSGQRTTLIKAHLLRHKQKRPPYLYEIFPLYNQEGRCVGTVFYGKKPDTFSLPPIRYFTLSEWQIIFYLLRTFNTREITIIKNRIGIIDPKAKVNSLREFKIFYHQTGFDRYFSKTLSHVKYGVLKRGEIVMSNRQSRIRKRALRNKLLAAKRREKNKTWFTRLMCLFKQEKTHVIF